MESEKISISIDEVNSERVDAEIHRQDIAARMAAHQEQVETNTPASWRFNVGFFRKAIVYMAVFGLAASIIGWGVGEISRYKSDHHPWQQCELVWDIFHKNNPDAGTSAWLRAIDNLRDSDNKEYRNNPYFRRSFWNQPDSELKDAIEMARRECKRLDVYWYVMIGLLIGLGLAIAEPVVGHNGKSAMLRGFIGAGLGALGGYICSLFINDVYLYLGGHNASSSFVQQIFARGVGWSILGMFLAIGCEKFLSP